MTREYRRGYVDLTRAFSPFYLFPFCRIHPQKFPSLSDYSGSRCRSSFGIVSLVPFFLFDNDASDAREANSQQKNCYRKKQTKREGERSEKREANWKLIEGVETDWVARQDCTPVLVAGAQWSRGSDKGKTKWSRAHTMRAKSACLKTKHLCVCSCVAIYANNVSMCSLPFFSLPATVSSSSNERDSQRFLCVLRHPVVFLFRCLMPHPPPFFLSPLPRFTIYCLFSFFSPLDPQPRSVTARYPYSCSKLFFFSF